MRRSWLAPVIAVAELLRHAGRQFDPEVVAAFRAELADPSRERVVLPHASAVDAPVLSVAAG